MRSPNTQYTNPTGRRGGGEERDDNVIYIYILYKYICHIPFALINRAKSPPAAARRPHPLEVLVELLFGVECQLLAGERCMSVLLRSPIDHVLILAAQCLVFVIKSQQEDSCHGTAGECNAVALDGTFAAGLAFSELISFYSENRNYRERFCMACQVLRQGVGQ